MALSFQRGLRCGASTRWAERSCSTGAFATLVSARLNMPGAQINDETQLGVWLSMICELDASDAERLLQAELGQTFAHANRCFCGAALQHSDTSAHSSEVSLRGPPSSAGCVDAQATTRTDMDATSARGSPPSSSSPVPCLTPPAGLFTAAGLTALSEAKGGSLVDGDVGDIHALALEQALVVLLQCDATTAQQTLESSLSAVFQHASICFCDIGQNASNQKGASKLTSAGSIVATSALEAAAPSGAASGAAAESKAIGGTTGVEAAQAGAGTPVAAGAVSGKAQSASGAEAAAASGESSQASAAGSAMGAASAAAAPADGVRDGGKGRASGEAATSAAPAASAASSGGAGVTAGGDAAVTGASLPGGSAKAAGTGTDSSVAASGPGAAAPSGAASGAAAESKAIGRTTGVEAAQAGAGTPVVVVPLDFSSAAATGASKSRSCAFCACGVQ